MSTLPLSGVNSRFFSVIPLSRFSLKKYRFFAYFEFEKNRRYNYLYCVNVTYLNPECLCYVNGRLDTFWGELGKLMEAGEPRFPHLSRLMTTLLVVPAGNASSEIVCSHVRKIATNFRSELCALLSVKWNVDDSATSCTCSAKLIRSAKSATYSYNQGHRFWNCEFRISKITIWSCHICL